MSTYFEVNDDYKMFETKAEVNYHDSITNYVSVKEMTDYMFSVLAEYDRCLTSKQDAKINPMTGRVTMVVKNGLIFEIPENIQKMAIAQYLALTSGPKIKKIKSKSARLEHMGNGLDDDNEEEQELEIEEPENETEHESDETEDFTVDMRGLKRKIRKMVPKTETRKDRMRVVIMVLLVLVALYASFRFIEDLRKSDF